MSQFLRGPSIQATQGSPECCGCFWCLGTAPETVEVTISGVTTRDTFGSDDRQYCKNIAGLKCEALNGSYVLRLRKRYRNQFPLYSFQGITIEPVISDCYWSYTFPEPICVRPGLGQKMTELILKYTRLSVNNANQPNIMEVLVWGPEGVVGGYQNYDEARPQSGGANNLGLYWNISRPVTEGYFRCHQAVSVTLPGREVQTNLGRLNCVLSQSTCVVELPA